MIGYVRIDTDYKINELKRASQLDGDGDWDSAHKSVRRIESGFLLDSCVFA